MGFFSNRRNKIITKAIDEAFLFNEGENIETRIHWLAAERFAQDKGAKIDRYADGGQSTSFELTMHDQEVSVIFVRHRMNETVIINAENSEKKSNRFKEKFLSKRL